MNESRYDMTKISHLLENDYKYENGFGCSILQLTDDGFKKKFPTKFFPDICYFNKLWYIVKDQSGQINLLNKDTGMLLDDRRWFKTIFSIRDDLYVLEDKFNNNYLIKEDGSYCHVPDFDRITELDNNLLFLSDSTLNQGFFVNPNDLAEQYSVIYDGSKSIALNPTNFINLQDKILIESSNPTSRECFLVNKKNKKIIKKIKDATIMNKFDNDIVCLKFNYSFSCNLSLFNSTTLALSPLYCKFFKLNNSYIYGSYDNKNCFGNIIDLNNLKLVDLELNTSLDNIIYTDNLVTYIKDGKEYNLT